MSREAAPTEPGVSLRGLARSSAYVNAAQLWQMASRLVLTPIVIARLGLDGYGAWTLVYSVCANAIALDSGAAWAYAKLTAELDEDGDWSRLSEVIGAGLLLVGSTVAVGLAAVWLARGWILPVLGVPPQLLRETEQTLCILSLAVAFKACLGAALPVLAGLQRMDLQYRFIICGSVVEFATALSLVLAGRGMTALPLGILAGEVVSIGAAWRACRRLRPALRLSPLHAGLQGVKQIVSVGLRFQGVVLMGTVARQAIRVALSGLYGTAALGIFNLAERLLSVAGGPALAIVSPLMPAFAKLGSGSHAWRWRQLFWRASKVAAVAAAVPLLFAAVFADPILFAWTGQRFPAAVWAARALAPVEFLAVLTGVAGARLRAAGTVRLEVIAGLAGSVLALAGMLVAYPVAGLAGSVVAVACGRCAGSAWLLARFASFGRLDGRRYLRTTVLAPVLRLAPLCALFAAAAFALTLLGSPDAGRWSVLGRLALLAAAYTLACTPVAWFLALSARDRATVVRLRRRARGAAHGPLPQAMPHDPAPQRPAR